MDGTNARIDESLIKKYDPNLYAMYVDYPHKSRWAAQADDHLLRVALGKIQTNRPFLLYVHIPFCSRQCYYCTCHTFVTRQYKRVERYLDSLYREIDLLAELVHGQNLPIYFREIHLGGGSPTYLKRKDFGLLMSRLQKLVPFKDLVEFSIEIDPRDFDPAMLDYYHDFGINRLSFGVQDFDPAVQKAVNRVQPPELLDRLLTADVRRKFHGINFDIMWGLPRQSLDSFRRTLDTVIRMAPDRISLLYLHMATELKKHQKLMKPEELPTPFERTRIFHMAVQILIEQGGYVRIGFEHFAKPDDDLAKALRQRTLYWNSLGYTAGRYLDILGIGSGSSSNIMPDYYFQNTYNLEEYEQKVKASVLPVFRGYQASSDDIVRRDVIQQLRSYFDVDYGVIDREHSVRFREYFAEELRILEGFARDGIVELSEHGIRITERGRFFMFHICRVFDRFVRLEGC